MASWTEGLPGGQAEASELIMKALQCGYSKAEKLARGGYAASLNPFEQRELLNLTKKPSDILFPGLHKKRKSRAS
jgi:hypothetical protein